MKKFLVILLLAATSLFAQPTNYLGSGTQEDPYQITRTAQFDSLRYWSDDFGAGQTYWWKVMQNIDFVDVEYWVPIGHVTSNNPWTGSIDGNNKTLSNLTIDTTFTDTPIKYIGFFGNMGAGDAGEVNDGIKVLHNIVLSNFNINIDGSLAGGDGMFVGILTGLSAGNIGSTDIELDSITILGSSLTVDLPNYNIGANFVHIGGMSGNTYRAHHIYVNADITVTMGTNTLGFQEGIGGIAGGAADGICYSAFVGNIRTIGEGMPVGGLIGYPKEGVSTEDSTINNYVRAGILQGGYYVGGMIGLNTNSSSGRYRNNYTQIDTLYSYYIISERDLDGLMIGAPHQSAVYTSVYADTQAVLWSFGYTGSEWTIWDRGLKSLFTVGDVGSDSAKTTAEMLDVDTYVDWDFTNVWEIDPGENDGYPTLRWVVIYPDGPILYNPNATGIVYRASDEALIHWTAGIDTPLTTSYLHYSVNGGEDWILIDTLVATDTSYLWTVPDTPTTQGQVRITEEGDMITQESISSNDFTILSESTLDIYYPIEKEGQSFRVGDTLHIDIASSFVDNIWLYWSPDSSVWFFMDSTIVDTVNLAYIDTTTYVWTFDGLVTGPEVWVKANEQDDTTLYSFSRDLNDLGGRYPRGIWVCQTDSGGTLVEWFVFYDVSCGWTQPSHTYYNSRIGDLGEDYDVIGNTYAWPYEDAVFPRSDPVHIITGSDTADVYLNAFYDQYGATVTYKNRLYYIDNMILYCNDIVNEIDSIVVSDLSDQYTGLYPWTEGNEILQVYHVQRTKVSDQYLASNTVFESLNDSWFSPLMLINGGTTFPARTITVKLLDYPANDNPADDTEKVLTGSSFTRFYFRGIHPKILKE